MSYRRHHITPDPSQYPLIYSIVLAFLLSVLMLPALADSTTVYKKKMPDGSISYSDQNTGSAERIEVQPVPTVPAIKVPASNNRDTQQSQAPSDRYAKFRIIQPGHDTSFWSGNGELTVQLEVEPALLRGHNVKLRLDGEEVSNSKSTSIVLSGVDRGTHSLEASIIDASGAPLKTATSTFTIHRPIVKP